MKKEDILMRRASTAEPSEEVKVVREVIVEDKLDLSDVTVAVEALEKITAATSGSYNAAVALKADVVSLAIGLDDLRASVIELKSSTAPHEQMDHLEAVVQQLTKNYGRLEEGAEDQVTLQQKTAEQVERFTDFMEERLDMIVAVETAKSHESRISILESQLAELARQRTAKDSLAQAIWRNLIAIAALIVLALSFLKALGRI